MSTQAARPDDTSAEVLYKPESRSKAQAVSHNLLGQRLGRKGQETRERILNAALRLLESGEDAPLTLTGVAREAEVGMTNLYLYFPDIGDLALAALSRVMESADAEFLDQIKTRWPDESLGQCCLAFVRAHYRFWRRHARILHLRNSFADANDVRFVEYRNRSTQPLRDLLLMQMGGHASRPRDARKNLAIVLLIGFERVATVLTNANFRITAKDYAEGDEADYIEQLIAAEAALMSLAIRQQREVAG